MTQPEQVTPTVVVSPEEALLNLQGLAKGMPEIQQSIRGIVQGIGSGRLYVMGHEALRSRQITESYKLGSGNGLKFACAVLEVNPDALKSELQSTVDEAQIAATGRLETVVSVYPESLQSSIRRETRIFVQRRAEKITRQASYQLEDEITKGKPLDATFGDQVKDLSGKAYDERLHTAVNSFEEIVRRPVKGWLGKISVGSPKQNPKTEFASSKDKLKQVRDSLEAVRTASRSPGKDLPPTVWDYIRNSGYGLDRTPGRIDATVAQLKLKIESEVADATTVEKLKEQIDKDFASRIIEVKQKEEADAAAKAKAEADAKAERQTVQPEIDVDRVLDDFIAASPQKRWLRDKRSDVQRVANTVQRLRAAAEERGEEWTDADTFKWYLEKSIVYSGEGEKLTPEQANRVKQYGQSFKVVKEFMGGRKGKLPF